MKKLVLVLLSMFIGVASAAGRYDGDAAWKERNRGSAPISSYMNSVPLHGGKSNMSSFDMGVCAASIVNTRPATAKRILDEAIARGERAEFYRGAESLVAQVNRDPVAGWQKGEQACSGHLLAPITFKKVEAEDVAKAKK